MTSNRAALCARNGSQSRIAHPLAVDTESKALPQPGSSYTRLNNDKSNASGKENSTSDDPRCKQDALIGTAL